MLDDILDSWPEVDRGRVYVIGHSNGGFMSYRLACDRADVIAAIGVLAGDAASTACTPSQHVSVLHMHGTADDTVPYSVAAPSIAKWAGYNGCGTTRHMVGTADYVATLPGDETTIEDTDGCPAGTDVELWSMVGGSHIPSLTPTFEPALWAWLGAHHR